MNIKFHLSLFFLPQFDQDCLWSFFSSPSSVPAVISLYSLAQRICVSCLRRQTDFIQHFITTDTASNSYQLTLQVSHDFWNVTPCSPVKVNRRFQGNISITRSKVNPIKKTANTNLLVACFVLVSLLARSSALKIEEIRSSETSVDFCRITQHCIADVRDISIHLCENPVVKLLFYSTKEIQ
jgi:hypothetical protein